MTKYIYSTLSTDVLYTAWANNDPKQNSIAEKQILIRGGANVVGAITKDKNDLSVAAGTLNEVSDKDFEILQGINLFQFHVANGFIQFSDKKAESIESAVEVMEPVDNSAQLNAKFYDKEENENLAKPESGKSHKKHKGDK